MKHKRNPIGDEFDNNVIEEMQTLAGSIDDHLFSSRQEIVKLQEYITEYDDGSWKFNFLGDVNRDIRKIEVKFENLWKVLETFKDQE